MHAKRLENRVVVITGVWMALYARSRALRAPGALTRTDRRRLRPR